MSVVIAKHYMMEDGRKVMILEPTGDLLSDVIESAVKVANSKKKCDEFRLTVNERLLIFTHDIEFDELRNMYYKTSERLSQKDYERLEFTTASHIQVSYNLETRFADLTLLIDEALYTKDYEWAKELANEKREIAQVIQP